MLLLPMLMLLLLLLLLLLLWLLLVLGAVATVPNALINVQPVIDVFKRLFVAAILLLSNVLSLLLNFNAVLDVVAGFVANAADIVIS